MSKIMIGAGVAGLVLSGSAVFATSQEPVTSYSPEVSVTCEGVVSFSHPAFKSAFGESEHLKYDVNGGARTVIQHGEVITIDYVQGLDVQIFAIYPGVGFDHGIGRVKPQLPECEVEVPEEPGVPVEDIPEEEIPPVEEPEVPETTVPEAPVVEEPKDETPADVPVVDVPVVKPVPPVAIETARK